MRTLVCVVFAAAVLWSQQEGSGYLGLALEDSARGPGARIAQVVPGGPAANAGLEPGDVILAVNGAAVNRADATARMFRSLEPGKTARIVALRARSGQRQEVAVMVGRAPGASGLVAGAAPVAPLPANLRFERLTDPIEHAFTIDAPAGWRSVAGLARAGLVQVNPYLRSLSPDRMTYVLFGDPTFPTFTVPSQMRNTIGLREGAATYDGVGGRGEIRRYEAGAEFARSYGQVALGSVCRGLSLAGSRDLPDLARKIEQMDRNVIPTRYDAGEAEFTCTHNQQQMAGYAVAVTWITRDQIGMWVVRGFVGFITPQAQMARMKGVMQHIVDSLTWTPEWNQRQTELSRQAGEVIKQRIAGFERQQAAFNAKLNEEDRSFQEMDDIITGRSRYYDPRTGTKYDLSNTAPVKWINDGGRIVGTAANVPPPGIGWRRLPAAQ